MALKTKLKMEMKANSCHPKINLAEYCRDGRWEEVGNVLNCCGCLVNDKSESVIPSFATIASVIIINYPTELDSSHVCMLRK